MVRIKQQFLSDIIAKMKDLGISVQTGKEADISVNAEFLNAGWSTGKKKIRYEASVFADERDNTVYMFEKTTESGQGFSFGSGSETSVQSGKTLFRKVKSVQYGPDGKVYEIDLDLGAIPKSVKETALQYGWKFKTVLSKKKAQYPDGYAAVPVNQTAAPANQTAPQTAEPKGFKFCAKCGAQIDSNAKFCNKCGSPTGLAAKAQEPRKEAKPQVAPFAPPEKNNTNPNATIPPVGGKNEPSKNKTVTFRWAGIISLAIIACIFFWAGNVSAFGWLFGAALIIALFLIQRSPANQGCLRMIILWVASLVLLFLILVFASADDETSSASTETGSQASETTGTEDSYAQNYLDLGYSFSVCPSGTDHNDYQNGIYGYDLTLICSLFEQISVNDSPADPEGSKVKEIRIKNFALTGGPDLGTFGGLELAPELNMEFYPKVENGEVVYNTEEYSQQYYGWSSSLCFRFVITDVATYTYPKDYSGTYSIEISYKNAGIVSDDLRFGCSYDVELVTMAGDTYIKHVDVDPIPGDFLYDVAQTIVDTRVMDDADGVSFHAI